MPPITKTIQVRWARHTGHCWRSRDELVSDVLLWTPTYGQAKAGRPARTYIQQLCEDTECNPEDLPEAMNDREKWREMVKDIRAGGTTWWWWWWHSRYHTITYVCTTALLPTKPSSDDDSGFRHGFRAEASLPLTQSAPAVSYDTTRFCQIVVTLWDCQIHADAVRALSWIFSMYFLLSDGGSPRLVKKMEVELVIKPLHLTSIGNTFVIQPFLTHCSCRSSYFSNLHWCAQLKFSSKGTFNSITKTFFALTAQMTIIGHFVINAISVIYIVTVLVVTNSLCGFKANQVWYNLESAQYLWLSYYIIIINEYIKDFIYLMPWKFVCNLRFHTKHHLYVHTQ